MNSSPSFHLRSRGKCLRADKSSTRCSAQYATTRLVLETGRLCGAALRSRRPIGRTILANWLVADIKSRSEKSPSATSSIWRPTATARWPITPGKLRRAIDGRSPRTFERCNSAKIYRSIVYRTMCAMRLPKHWRRHHESRGSRNSLDGLGDDRTPRTGRRRGRVCCLLRGSHLQLAVFLACLLGSLE